MARTLDVVLAGALAVVGGLAMASSFQMEDLLRPVGAGAVVAMGVSLVVTGILAARLAWSLLAAVAVLVPVAAAASGGGIGDVATGLVDGSVEILHTAGVAPAEPALLVVPFALAAVAAFVGAELAQRVRAPAAPCLPSLVVLAVGLAFGFEGRIPPVGLPVAWAALAAVTLGWRTRRAAAARTVTRTESSPARKRSLVGATATVLAVALPAAGAAHAVAPRLPGLDDRPRFSLRDLTEQEAEELVERNPLDLMVQLRNSPDDALQFSSDTSARVERWRVAVLDDFTGSEWVYRGDFTPAGDELQPPATQPDDESATEPGPRLSQKIETAGWVGPWLPVADRAVDISVDGAQFDPATGVLLTERTRPPRRYDVESVLPQPDGATLADAAAADDEEARAALKLPDGMPDELVAAADEATAGTGSAFARAVAIERYLTDPTMPAPFQLADDAVGGVSWGHLRWFLGAQEGQRRGTVEQFVTTFAVMARRADLPTRIVVGFDGSGTAGRNDVNAHSATAWAEVKFEGVGWVVFDPVPDPDAATDSTPQEAEIPTGGPNEDTPAPTVPPTAAGEGTANADAGAAEDEGNDPVWQDRRLWAAAAIAVALVALPGVVRSHRRRRRRGAGSPAERIVGAWMNAVDQLALAGLAVTRDRAVSDLVVAGRAAVPTAAAEPLGPLGRLTNLARFAPSSPDRGAADEAWALSDRFAEEVRKSRSLGQRLRDYFRLRSVPA